MQLLIWWHQLYLRRVFGHVRSPNSIGTCPFVKTLHNLINNYVQIIAYQGERDPTVMEINGNNWL